MEELLVGFRFFPTEEELLSFYLPSILEGRREDIQRVIPIVNVFDLDPWELPEHGGERCRGDSEQWFFFAPMQEREARGGRPNRTTPSGYWKATGTPGNIYSSDNRFIGMKKTMVFYTGKAPTGSKTKWKMNEYKAIEEGHNSSVESVSKLRNEFSVCRVYVTPGSNRAFDRRPPEPPARYAPVLIDVSSTSQAAVFGAIGSSTEASSSDGDQAYIPEIN